MLLARAELSRVGMLISSSSPLITKKNKYVNWVLLGRLPCRSLFLVKCDMNTNGLNVRLYEMDHLHWISDV